MPVLLKELIAERGEPLCVRQEAKLCDALKQMLGNDYSQLPVVNQYGQLTGLISEQSIVRTYFDFPNKFSLDLLVTHCPAILEIMSGDDELSQALDRIKKIDAIVIVDKRNKPIGILTDYDTTHFLRDLFEAYTFLEDVEVTIGAIIEEILATEDQRKAALFHAFGADKRDSTKPKVAFDEMTLHEKTQVIITEENWSKFEAIFKPRDFFDERMKKIGAIRNRLMHFQRKPDALEYQTLKAASQWAKFLRRPTVEQAKTELIEVTSSAGIPTGAYAGKYDPLCEWLKNRPDNDSAVLVKFDDIERLLNAPLPPMALEHPSWWANVKVGRVQSKAWLEAGWKVADVDFAAREVTFQRVNAALNQQFFADLLERIKQNRPGITQARKTQAANWFSFSAGRSGYYFGWAFGRGDVLRVDLYIDSNDAKANKVAFDALEKHKAEIESEIAMELEWERLDDNRQSRIRVERHAKITDSKEELEKAKEWAVETMLKFVDTFQKRIKAL